MKTYLITDIEFDFECEDPPSLRAQSVLMATWKNRTIELEDEQDVADYISDRTGWCVQFVSVDEV